jgi:hypothetical protein
MVYTSVSVWACFPFAVIILDFRLTVKCAICLSDGSLHPTDGSLDLPQADLGNGTGRTSEDIDGRGGIELMHPFKAVRGYEIVRMESEASQHRVSNSRLQGDEETHPQVLIVQFLQKAPFLFVGKLLEIVGHVVGAEGDGGIQHGIAEIASIFVIVHEAILQGFDDVGMVFGLHPPKLKGTLIRPFPLGTGIADVENVVETVAAPLFVDKGDTRRAPLDPSSEVGVPQLHPGAGDCLGALGEYENLVCKRIFVLIRCRVQKSSPRHRVRCDFFDRPLIQAGY